MKTAKNIFLNITCQIKNTKYKKKLVKFKSFTNLTCQVKPDFTIFIHKNSGYRRVLMRFFKKIFQVAIEKNKENLVLILHFY